MRQCNTNLLTGLGDTQKLTDILLPFKTKLPTPKTISFINDEENECDKTIKIKSGTATLYNDRSRGIKIKVPIWGYDGKYLGPAIETRRNQRIVIDWVNAVPNSSRQPSIAVKVDFSDTTNEIVPQNILGNPVDSKMTMGHDSAAAYFFPHQHGGKTAPSYDGGPEDLIRYKQNYLNQYQNHQRATDSVGDQILCETENSIITPSPIMIVTEQLADTHINANLDDNEQCLKDTVCVNPGEMVDIIAQFEEHHGRFVYHCHLLEHEDHDMMRQFIVTRNDLDMMHNMLPISISRKECL